MDEDISINNISNDDTTTSQFITFLINALNEQNATSDDFELPLTRYFNRRINSRIQQQNRIPLFNRRNRFQELLQSSLYDKNNVKKILSEKGNEQLKLVKFRSDKFDTNECVITQDEFEEGEEIIQLPCGHIFKPEAIKTWLKEESSKCPICRFELDFVEKSEKPEITPVEQVRDLSNNRLNMLRNMRLMYNPSSIFLPQRQTSSRRNLINNMLDMESQYFYDRNLQNAILSSITETENVVLDDNNNDTLENDNIQDADDFFSMIESDMVLEDIDDDEEYLNSVD